MLIIGSYFFTEIKSEKELICYIIYVIMLKLN